MKPLDQKERARLLKLEGSDKAFRDLFLKIFRHLDANMNDATATATVTRKTLNDWKQEGIRAC